MTTIRTVSKGNAFFDITERLLLRDIKIIHFINTLYVTIVREEGEVVTKMKYYVVSITFTTGLNNIYGHMVVRKGVPLKGFHFSHGFYQSDLARTLRFAQE